jgi:hypothetical protein
MTENETLALFVVLAGYWPTSAPDPDDPVAIAAHRDILDDLDPTILRDAVRMLSREGREFCPPPGVIAAACKPRIVPPYHAPYVPELEPPKGEDLDVPALLEETRHELRYRRTQR